MTSGLGLLGDIVRRILPGAVCQSTFSITTRKASGGGWR
jgi:hypothetical protein